jgi:purine catabolism regulator
VHSSEIYEIAPLLSGGELLLTSGLGLLAADPGARRYYVRDLASRGVAALALALNRSFTSVPEEMVTEAALVGLPLIALTEVVPFVRISEELNTLLVDDSVRRLRFGDALSASLQEVVLAGGGVAGVLAELGRQVPVPVVLVASNGALLGMYGVETDAAAWRLVAAPGAVAEVVQQGETWARLYLGVADDVLPAADRAALALGLAASQSGRPSTEEERQRSALLAELVEAEGRVDADAMRRAARLGFRPGAGAAWLAFAAEASSEVESVLDTATHSPHASLLRAPVGGQILGFLALPDADPVRAAASALAPSEVPIALGYPVVPAGSYRRLGSALREARDVLSVAGSVAPAEPGPRPAVVSARSLALELRLTRDSSAAELASLVEQLLGPLLRWDVGHSSDLVRTLEVHLRHGTRPTRTAELLHVGRQTLYQRLGRIEALLGCPVGDPELHVSWLLACCAHRVLGGAGQAP